MRTCGISVIPAGEEEEGGAGESERASGLSTPEPGGPGERSAFHLFSGAFIPAENGTWRSAESAPRLPGEEGGGAGQAGTQWDGEGRVWREGWSRGEAPISSLAGRAISPTPGNGHVQPRWRSRTGLPPWDCPRPPAGAWPRTDASAHNVARGLGDGDGAGDSGTGVRVGVETCPGQGRRLRRPRALEMVTAI